MSPTFATASCNATEMMARSSASWASRRSGAGLAAMSLVLVLPVTFDATDLGATGPQLLFQTLEPAIQMIDPVDHRLAARRQAGDHQADGGAQVGRHPLGAFQRIDAARPRLAALHRDLGAHARQFRHVHEAVLEDGLPNDAFALGEAHQGYELRLQIV